MKRWQRMMAALLAMAMVCGALMAGASAAGTNSLPYEIKVNRKMNTVTVYTQDKAGNYTVPYKAMICSTGRLGHATPLGSYSVTSVKKEWCLMFDGTYGQYSTQFYGNYLFHSICYTAPDPATMLAQEYNMLGGVASLGCVRLQTADAKWIYDNCAPGTRVTIYDSDDPGPLGKPVDAGSGRGNSALAGGIGTASGRCRGAGGGVPAGGRGSQERYVGIERAGGGERLWRARCGPWRRNGGDHGEVRESGFFLHRDGYGRAPAVFRSCGGRMVL